eukprot:snap_masked-scaffold_18-processed-gene-2.33-mRNA-1 protein AED:1.00 eAED:1.00 QI:0/-1/0/0/-1/1/1/0/1158
MSEADELEIVGSSETLYIDRIQKNKLENHIKNHFLWDEESGRISGKGHMTTGHSLGGWESGSLRSKGLVSSHSIMRNFSSCSVKRLRMRPPSPDKENKRENYEETASKSGLLRSGSKRYSFLRKGRSIDSSEQVIKSKVSRSRLFTKNLNRSTFSYPSLHERGARNRSFLDLTFAFNGGSVGFSKNHAISKFVSLIHTKLEEKGVKSVSWPLLRKYCRITGVDMFKLKKGLKRLGIKSLSKKKKQNPRLAACFSNAIEHADGGSSLEVSRVARLPTQMKNFLYSVERQDEFVHKMKNIKNRCVLDKDKLISLAASTKPIVSENSLIIYISVTLWQTFQEISAGISCILQTKVDVILRLCIYLSFKRFLSGTKMKQYHDAYFLQNMCNLFRNIKIQAKTNATCEISSFGENHNIHLFKEFFKNFFFNRKTDMLLTPLNNLLALVSSKEFTCLFDMNRLTGDWVEQPSEYGLFDLTTLPRMRFEVISDFLVLEQKIAFWNDILSGIETFKLNETLNEINIKPYLLLLMTYHLVHSKKHYIKSIIRKNKTICGCILERFVLSEGSSTIEQFLKSYVTDFTWGMGNKDIPTSFPYLVLLQLYRHTGLGLDIQDLQEKILNLGDEDQSCLKSLERAITKLKEVNFKFSASKFESLLECYAASCVSGSKLQHSLQLCSSKFELCQTDEQMSNLAKSSFDLLIPLKAFVVILQNLVPVLQNRVAPRKKISKPKKNPVLQRPKNLNLSSEESFQDDDVENFDHAKQIELEPTLKLHILDKSLPCVLYEPKAGAREIAKYTKYFRVKKVSKVLRETLRTKLSFLQKTKHLRTQGDNRTFEEFDFYSFQKIGDEALKKKTALRKAKLGPSRKSKSKSIPISEQQELFLERKIMRMNDRESLAYRRFLFLQARWYQENCKLKDQLAKHVYCQRTDEDEIRQDKNCIALTFKERAKRETELLRKEDAYSRDIFQQIDVINVARLRWLAHRQRKERRQMGVEENLTKSFCYREKISLLEQRRHEKLEQGMMHEEDLWSYVVSPLENKREQARNVIKARYRIAFAKFKPSFVYNKKALPRIKRPEQVKKRRIMQVFKESYNLSSLRRVKQRCYGFDRLSCYNHTLNRFQMPPHRDHCGVFTETMLLQTLEPNLKNSLVEPSKGLIFDSEWSM